MKGFYHLDIKPMIIVECSDTNNEKTGSNGKGCSKYEVSDCGTHDDDDFKSNEMCCVCGGGRNGNEMNQLNCYCSIQISFFSIKNGST